MLTSFASFRYPRSLSRGWRLITRQLPPLNFITLHYAYFIGVCLLCSVIFWGASTPRRSVTYTDSLFLVVSAMTLAGMNTINLSTINTFQQVLLFFLTILGSAIWVSIAVIFVRRNAFERRFKSIVEQARARKRGRDSLRRRFTFSKTTSGQLQPEVDGVVVRGRVIKSEEPVAGGVKENSPIRDGPETGVNGRDKEKSPDVGEEGDERADSDLQHTLHLHPTMTRRITFAEPRSPTQHREHTRIFSMQGVGARGDLRNHPLKARKPIYPSDLPRLDERDLGDIDLEPNRGFLSEVFIGRNSQFSNLSLAERERLGGVEYRAISILAIIVPLYFFLWQFLGSIGLGAYVARNRPDTARVNGENPWWVGIFNGVSAFNNNGMSLLDANMVAFQDSYYMLITMGLLILAGNTCYPVFLRLIIWTIWKFLPDNIWKDHKITLRFLLDHPRRCYTNLFPSRHTWWLLATIFSLNVIDWIAFEVLNIGNETITSLESGPRAIDGLFQALAVRSGGFYVVPVSGLRIGLLVLYLIMMYISVYPVVITMRNSNVYEERSLGIYADDPQVVDQPSTENQQQQQGRASGAEGRDRGRRPAQSATRDTFGPLQTVPTNRTTSKSQESKGYFVRQQLRGQLAHDLWWIVLAVLFITICETSSFDRDPVNYSVFNIIFEVVSAYGCVGISVGLPNVAYSFCGGWRVLSKLILCAVMLQGRHRGLPVAIDRAVLLPGDHLVAAEEEDAQIRFERSRSGLRSRTWERAHDAV